MEKKYILPDLPYAYDALEPSISKEIMELHHGKHHQGYVNNLNAALEKHPELFEKSPEELLRDLAALPEDIRTAVRNNGGGHVNHSLFWEIMAPNAGGEPGGNLADGINTCFGSFADFQAIFNEMAGKVFGSGWVWLVKTPEGKLEVMTTPNQDSPLSQGLMPIMGNDVWEHAYYLQYKNVRADYVRAWWNVVNWKKVEEKFLMTN
jgi:Fe-Mn family superoxide dismutase